MRIFFLPLILASTFAAAQTPNIGINSPNPRGHLEIDAATNMPNIKLSQTTAADYARLRFDNFSAAYWEMQANVAGTAAASRLNIFVSGTGINPLTFTGGGPVGIGLNNPQEALHINGNLQLSGSSKGIILNNADAAMISRGFDPFTSGTKMGLGRWGLFMEPSMLAVGIPNIAGKRAAFAKYNADGTFSEMGSAGVDGSLRIPGLSGAGTRTIAANGDGSLAPNTTPTQYYLNIDGRDFITYHRCSILGEITDYCIGGDAVYQTGSHFRGNFTDVLVTNLLIPDGATVTSFTVYFTDNHDYGFQMHYPGNGHWLSPGKEPGVRSVVVPTNILVNNTVGSFGIFLSSTIPIFTSLYPAWDGDVAVLSFDKIIVTYQRQQ